jgi:hypothetical protein
LARRGVLSVERAMKAQIVVSPSDARPRGRVRGGKASVARGYARAMCSANLAARARGPRMRAASQLDGLKAPGRGRGKSGRVQVCGTISNCIVAQNKLASHLAAKLETQKKKNCSLQESTPARSVFSLNSGSVSREGPATATNERALRQDAKRKEFPPPPPPPLTAVAPRSRRRPFERSRAARRNVGL